MSLNCKPGDLARIVDCYATRLTGIVDKIIQVTEYSGITEGGLGAWLYEGVPLRCVCGCGRPILAVGDNLLRPIRGQEGDDQTLDWAGRPATHDAPVAA